MLRTATLRLTLWALAAGLGLTGAAAQTPPALTVPAEEILAVHLPPGGGPETFLRQYGLTAYSLFTVPGGPSVIGVRAQPGTRQRLALAGVFVEPDHCRQMLQGPVLQAADGCDKKEEAVAGSTAGNHVSSATEKDPVDTYTGELLLAQPPDLDLGGPAPVMFQRYYASALDGLTPVDGVARGSDGRPRAATVVAGESWSPEAFLLGAGPGWDARPLIIAAAGSDGRFGPLPVPALPPGRLGTSWRHGYEWTLSRTGARLTVHTDRGRTLAFVRDGPRWRQASGLDTAAQLVESPDGFTFAFHASRRLRVFDRAGRLTKVEDGRGQAVVLTYRGARLVEVADGLGRRLALAYDGQGRLVEVGDGARFVRFGHTGPLLTQVTDVLGGVTRYHYDTAHARPGLLTAVTRPAGNTPHTQAYDPAGRVATQTSADGHATRFDYRPGETAITDPSGRTRRHAYDAAGRLTAMTDEAGRTFTLAYDQAGRRSGITDRLGDTTRYAYHEPSGSLASATHADGTTTAFEHAARRAGALEAHDLARIVRPDGSVERFAHDGAGNVAARTDPAGHTSRYTHDTRGRVLTVTNPAGGVTTYAYHADGTLASRQDPAGNLSRFEYDGLRRLAAVRQPDGSARRYEHDAADRLVRLTDEGGRDTRFAYDANGNLTSVTGPDGATTRYAYDRMDRPDRVVAPDGGTARVEYDEQGRVRRLVDPTGVTVGHAYDPVGRLAAVTDPAGQVWSRRYDAEGVLVEVSGPLAWARRFVSDRMGRPSRVSTPDGAAVERTYDAIGRVTGARDAGGGSAIRRFEPRGLPVAAELPGGLATSYAWNPLGRLSRVVDPAGHAWEARHDPLGQVTATRDPLGHVGGYAYDSRRRLARVTLPGGVGDAQLSYDPTGHLLGIRYPDGTALAFAYDAAGRLVTGDGLAFRHDGAGRLVESNGLALGRDAAGRLTRVTFAPGKTVEYAYDPAGRLAEVRDWLAGRTTFAYDLASRPTAVARPNGVTTTYGYDRDGRLVEIREGASARITLTRDARGLIASADRRLPLPASAPPPAQTSLAYDAGARVAAFAYDALGRLVRDDRRSYAWDLASRLVTYTEAGRTVRFTYDGLGQRLSRAADGVTRSYVWNYALGVPSVSIEREGGADRAYYLHTPDGGLLARIDARDGSRRFYHFDEMGHTRFLTDDRGAVVARHAYTPYGVPVATADDPDNPFTWGGRFGVMREGAGGLYYVRARYYDGATARFLSRDPLPSLGPRTVNPYQYARGNPLRYTDPLGLQSAEPPGGPPPDPPLWIPPLWTPPPWVPRTPPPWIVLPQGPGPGGPLLSGPNPPGDACAACRDYGLPDDWALACGRSRRDAVQQKPPTQAGGVPGPLFPHPGWGDCAACHGGERWFGPTTVRLVLDGKPVVIPVLPLPIPAPTPAPGVRWLPGFEGEIALPDFSSPFAPGGPPGPPGGAPGCPPGADDTEKTPESILDEIELVLVPS